MTDLFEGKYHPNEHEVRTRQRPLGPISDFVVEQLPIELEAIRGGKSTENLVREAYSLIQGMPSFDARIQDAHSRDLAGLDLKILEAAIAHSGAIPPDSLVLSVDAFAAKNNQPPAITYEEIILINPPADHRTFTRGEPGQSEADFYEGHRRIEAYLAQAINTVELGIQALTSGSEDVGTVGVAIGTRADYIEQVIHYMHAIGMKMPKEHFAEFRPYLGTHPIRQTKGPSGAFTARIPILELLLAGEHLPEEYMQYLENNKMYFPRSGRIQIDQARSMVEEGLTLTALSRRLGNPEALDGGIDLLGKSIRKFRGVHYKGVAHQVPGAISGHTRGTGGEIDPGTFLRERMKIRHTNYEK